MNPASTTPYSERLTCELINLRLYGLLYDWMAIADTNHGGATNRVDNFTSVLERDVDSLPTDRNRRSPRRAVQNCGGLEGRNPFLGGNSGDVMVERRGHGAMQGSR